MAIEQAATTLRPARDYKWELMFWLWLAFFFNQADRQIFSVVAPLIKTRLGLNDAQIGLVASILSWTLAALVPLAGYLGDVKSKKWIITYSLLFWSMATMFTGLAGTMLQLVLLRSVATGAGEAFYGPASNALIGQYHSRTRALALSIHQTALYVGMVASGWIGGYLGQVWGWSSAFYVFGSGGLVLGVLLAWRLRDAPRADSAAAIATQVPARECFGVLLRTPTAPLLILAFTSEVFVNIGYLTWTPTHLYEKFNLPLDVAGFSAMFYHHVAALVGVLVSGQLSDWWSRRRRSARLEIQAVALLMGAPFIYLMGEGSGQAATYVGMAGFGLFRGIYDANIYASLFDVIRPRYRSSASGIMIMFAFLTGALSPALLGWLKPHLGLSHGLAALSSIYVGGGVAVIVALIFFFRRDYCGDADGC